MPPWLTDLLKLLGLTTPFIYAAATYGFFHWLDKKASGPAKRALTARLQATIPSSAVADFTVEVFDRIYSSPLLHWRAMLRSAAITLVVCGLVWYEVKMNASSIRGLSYAAIFNIVTDYISLFFVRKWLVTAVQRPIMGLIAASLTGIVVIYVGYLLRTLIIVATSGSRDIEFMWILYTDRLAPFELVPFAVNRPLHLIMPAVLVHLWLPLFALAALMTQALAWFVQGVGWMQWFLKQGQHHPFEAVGYLAATLVLVATAAIQFVAR